MNQPDTDRRINLGLRAVFVEACAVVKPFFDPATTWGGQPHEHLAYRALHERFPALSAEEVQIIVTAARRVFASGGKPAP